MSEELLPTTPHNSNLDTASTENTSKGYLLAQQLCNLQQENLVVGKQNQELALQLQDASNYNQALGLDLYQLDQEIGELEERLSKMKIQIKEMDQQTKTITKKADEYKNALRNDKEFSSLARHLRNLQKTHQAASKNLAQLRELLGDPNFSQLDGALQLMQEKIHFLYWSNSELHQQIELMQQLLNEGREGAIIEDDLEKMNDLSAYKLEYYDMKLFESQMKDDSKKYVKTNVDETDSSSSVDSAKYILLPSKNKKPFTQAKDDESNSKISRKFKGKNGLYEDVFSPDETNEGNYKIFRRPLKSDGKRRKYKSNNSKTKKFRQTRVQNKNGDEYEYQYEYDYNDVDENDNKNNKKGKKTRVQPKNEEIERIGAKQEDFKKLLKNPKTKTDKNETEEEEKGKIKNKNRRKYKKDNNDDDDTYNEIKRKKSHSKNNTNDKDSDADYEYEYEANSKEHSKSQKPKSGTKINNSKQKKKNFLKDNNDNDDEYDNQYPLIEEEEEELDSEFNDSQGFSHRRNQKTGKIERYRRFEFSDGKEYEDVIVPDYERMKTNIKMKRNRIDKKNNTYKHVKKKTSKNDDKFIISRHERVLHDNDEEYEYEYEYEIDGNDQKAKNRSPKRHRVSGSSEIIPTFNYEDENGFRIQTTTNSKNEKEKKKIRKYKDDDGETYKDTIEMNENTGEIEVHRRTTKSETNDSLKYSTKKNKLIRHSRSHNLINGNEIEHEYEYDTDKDGGRILISKSQILNPDDEIIPPIILKSETRTNRREQQGFGDAELIDDKKEIRKRKTKGKNGVNYEDVLESDPNDGSQRISRRIKNGDNLQYTEINKKGKNKPIKTRRTRVQNDDKDEYEYEYEYDNDIDDDNKKRIKNRVQKKDELIDEIGDGPINKFKKQTDKKTGENILISNVKGKDGNSSYQDVITVNDQGETVVTRRLMSNDDDDKYQYSQKNVTDENGRKKKLRVRRSKVKYEDGREEEFEYEYDDVENTKTRKFVPKEDESIETITGVPKLSSKDKKMLASDKNIFNDLLSNFGFKDEIDQKTGRKKKVRITEDEFGQKFEYSKEQDPQTKETRITKRKLEPNGERLKYENIKSENKKMRKSEARIGDSEREYEYEYDNENADDQGIRKKLPKKDKDGFYKGKNNRVVLCDDGKKYEDIKIKGKIYRRPLSISDNANRHTRVRNANDEEYEYEYEPENGTKNIVKYIDDEIIPHIKLSSRPRNHKIGPNFALYKGREIRRIIGADGNEYEDEKIDGKIKRSKLDQNGQIEYKKSKVNQKGTKKRIKQRHVLFLNPDDEEIEYEYQYEFDSGNNDNPKKSRIISDDHEIESILLRPDFNEKTDPKTKKTRFIRQVIGSNGDIYEDEEDPKKNRIIRRKLDKEGSNKYSYKNHRNNTRTRRSRVAKLSPLDEDEEYEYEYEYDDKTGEVQRQKAENEIFEPIEKLNSKRYISDSSQFFEEEEDPETGEKKNIIALKHQNVEKIINPTTGKPMKVRKNGKDYEIIFDPKTNKTLRQRRTKLDNDDELVFEYDDLDVDENGNPKKNVKRIINDDQNNESFYEDENSNGMKTRRVKGKNGSFYIDTIENDGRIRRRVVNSLSSDDLIYKKKNNNKIVRHSRVHDERGDEIEYEYEYDNDDDDSYSRKIVADKNKHEIEVIKKNDFKQKIDPQTGEKMKYRIKQGKNGQIYEDTIKDNRILRRPLNKNDQKPKYDIDENGIKTRRSRVRNENNDEYEYEYEEDNGKVTKTRVHPEDENIERIDGSKTYKGGFIDQFETSNGSVADNKRKVRKVKGSNNQIFEDELIDGKIKRRPLNRKGKISYKKKNDKTVRRERVQNNNGDEYEYEYEYDDEENREKHRIDPDNEIIEPISVSDDEYENDYDEDENKNLDGFSSQMNEKTGEIEKSRKLTNKKGHVYKDTIEKNENTGEDEIHRRMIKSESTDELEYSKKLGKNHDDKIVRHSRTHNLATGDENEYEYEYETDKSGDKTNKGKKKKVLNPDDQIIQSILIVHKPKKSRPKKRKETNDDDDNDNIESSTSKRSKRSRSKSPSKELNDHQSEIPPDSESGLSGFHLPVSLFQSEDQSRPKPKLQQSNPSSTQQPKPPIIDLSEYESKVNPDKKNPLALLIPKLREESGINNDDINSPENLQRILEVLQQQIAERTEVRDQLRARIKELENPHYVKKNTATAKKAKNFKLSGIRRVNIESPPDPIKVLALNNYDLRHIGSQTDLTGETINYHQSVLDKQRREKLAAEELRASLESLKDQIRMVEGKIEKAKEDGQIKEERIKTLKIEIANVKDELLKEDKNTLREEEKAREYAKQLSEIDEQIRIKQQQLEKINSQVGALHLHLKEMQKFRVILESELANLVNREKPEIRQLIEDVNSYRIQIDVSSANVESMTKKVEAKRQQLEELLLSEEMGQYNELKLKKINLERRIKKWSSLMKDSRETLQSIETFSAKNANVRKNAIEQYKSKVRSFMKQEMELDDLEKYQELVEAMIREHKQNWM